MERPRPRPRTKGTNFARQRVPAIFIIEEQSGRVGYAPPSAPSARRLQGLACELRDLGATFDGNNVLDAYAATRIAAERVAVVTAGAMIAKRFAWGPCTHDEREARETFPRSCSSRGASGIPRPYEEYLKERA